MARWEPNARERLEAAALELFLHQGYDNTTVAGIAERAGLTKSTFFRHYADKREVLFGRDELTRLLASAIAEAPEDATPLAAVAAGLEAAEAAFSPERKQWVRDRQRVVARHPELCEREHLKRATLAEAMAGALRARGVGDPVAALVAELGGLALRTALPAWLDAPDGTSFAAVARRCLADLAAATADLR